MARAHVWVRHAGREPGSAGPSQRAHLDQVEWTPERLIRAKKMEPKTAALFEAVMSSKAHPQQGFKACLGIVRLAKQNPAERIEWAAARAPHFRTLNSCEFRKFWPHPFRKFWPVRTGSSVRQ